jgi:hypothetical protein
VLYEAARHERRGAFQIFMDAPLFFKLRMALFNQVGFNAPPLCGGAKIL